MNLHLSRVLNKRMFCALWIQGINRNTWNFIFTFAKQRRIYFTHLKCIASSINTFA